MKRFALAHCVAVALALHAGAIAIAWLGQATLVPGSSTADPQTCLAVAPVAATEQPWPEHQATSATINMPRPVVAASSPNARPSGDSELRQQPEPPPPLPEPEPELRQTGLPSPRLPAPMEQPWHRPARQPKAGPLPAADSSGGPDSPAPVWTAPRILTWQAPDKVRAGFHGRVIALLTIDEQGKVTAAELTQGTGNKNWDALLLLSFQDATCVAATCNGAPARGVLRQPVDFP